MVRVFDATNLVPLRHRDVEDVTTTYYDDAEFHENEEEPALCGGMMYRYDVLRYCI